MLNFFSVPHILSDEVVESTPWTFTSPDLARVRAMSKPARKEYMKPRSARWDIYSAVRAASPAGRVGDTNPAAGLRGIVVDYDQVQSLETVSDAISQIKDPDLKPNFIEVSLGMKIRLVWVFERELLVNGSEHCRVVLEQFGKKIGLPFLLGGYDPSSVKPQQIWTNGGEWHVAKEAPMSWATIFGVAVEASKTPSSTPLDISLEKIFDEVNVRWPGRWQGEFTLDAVGRRFWDTLADNATGCQVKPDGMLCFTGNVPFLKWEQILGAEWTRTQRTRHLGEAASEIYHDGRYYWMQLGGEWRSRSREDVLMELRGRGISSRVGKGQTICDAERVMLFIQRENRISGTAPLINYHPGILNFEGQTILNTSNIHALTPASKDGVVPVEDYPFAEQLMRNLFRDEIPLWTFCAWLKRAYHAQLNYLPKMGQAIFICGPKENGKTLLLMKIVKVLLGNRSANPYAYFTGETSFNSELFEVPFLAINDEEAPANDAARQKYQSRLKAFCVNPEHSYHPKFCVKLSVPWCGRCGSSLNEDPASVGLLPEVNSNTQDKMMFFASHPYQGTWPESEVIEATLERELPYFAKWLLEWTPPPEVLAPGRMGVKSYYDAGVLKLSRQQFQSFHCAEMLRAWINCSAYWVDGKKTDWEGTPTDLQSQVFLCEPLAMLSREWTVNRLSKALIDRSRIEGSGIKLVPSSNRIFRITRALLCAGQEPTE